MIERIIFSLNKKKVILLSLPFLLYFSTLAVFTFMAGWFGQSAGYILGFIFYWLVWCLLMPKLLLGKKGIRSLLVDKVALFSRTNWLPAVLLVGISVISSWMYLADFLAAHWSLILLAVPLATVNGFCEEILWRGLYNHIFSDHPITGILISAIGFALWHVVPLSVIPSEESTLAFVAMTFPLGLVYGWIAARTGSAKWTAISHSVNGIVALGGALTSSLLNLLA